MKYRSAFTLIEFLVVSAILALLAAILFPAFARTREAGRTASCSSNLAQISKAALQYCQDHDDHLPPLGTTLPSRVSWPQLLFAYVRTTNIFICPSDSATAPFSWATQPAPLNFPKPFHISYLMNSLVETEPGAGNALASIKNPAERIYLAEGASVASASAPFVTLSSNPKTSAWVLDTPANSLVTSAEDATYAAPCLRHSTTVNLAYADGHVKAVSVQSWYFPNSQALDLVG